jgi:hypothetical protein
MLTGGSGISRVHIVFYYGAALYMDRRKMSSQLVGNVRIELYTKVV